MADIKKPLTPAKPEIKPTTTVKPVATTAPAKPAVTAPAKPAEKKVTAKPATKKATAKKAAKPGRKPATKKATAKKATAKTTTAAKKATAKATAKKATAKPAAKTRGRKKAELDKTDVVKSALWKALSKPKAKKIDDYIAIQVYADGLESFFIAIHEGVPQIERSFYHGHNGDLQASEKELLAIAKGKYDLMKAVKAGNINFNGRLSILLQILDLF